MSKGLGRTERATLALLARCCGQPNTVEALAVDIELGPWDVADYPPGFKPSPSSMRSVERALRSLYRKGLVARIRQPLKRHGERGRPSDGWLLPADAAKWHARKRPQAASSPPAAKI